MNPFATEGLMLNPIREQPVLAQLFVASLEMVVLGVVVAAMIGLLRIKTPRYVALLWLLVLAKPIVSLVIGSPLPVVHLPAERSASTTEMAMVMLDAEPSELAGVAAPARPVATMPVENPFERAAVLPAPAKPSPRPIVAAASTPSAGEGPPAPASDYGAGLARFLVFAWMAGLAWMLAKASMGWVRTQSIVSASVPVPSVRHDEWIHVAEQLGVARPPGLRETDHIESPALVGLFRPVVLMPKWLVRGGADTRSALEWSMRHELIHWKHGDLWASWLRAVAQTLFFFHPIAWWAGRQWRVAMELACDRALVTSSAEARDYAEGLYRILSTVHRRRRVVIEPSLFATRTQIGRRIAVLLETSPTTAQRPGRFGLAALGICAVAGLAVGVGWPVTNESEASSASTRPIHSQPGSDSAVPNPFVTSTRCESLPADGQSDTAQAHVSVSAPGVPEDYVSAIRRTVAAARRIAIEKYQFDMPETIVVNVSMDAEAKVRLFTDGYDHISLTIRREDDLLAPQRSGIFHLYGLCHEVAHLSMYRTVKNRGWMTTAAAEGWAHYVGALLLDEVYLSEGTELWPDAYDYQAEGTRRFERPAGSAHSDSAVDRGAVSWKTLFETGGDQAARRVLHCWSEASVEPANPTVQLTAAMRNAGLNPMILDWWTIAATLFVESRPASPFALQQTTRNKLDGPQRELAHDGGRAAGKRSIAGGGHIVRFEVEDDAWFLTEVRIHGSRYGTPRPPNEDFHVWLCDSEMKAIADFPFPYSKFDRGNPGWVALSIPPTAVPRRFMVCVGFAPTATKGVFVSLDEGGGATSLVGLPGRPSRPLEEGNWMIRASVARQSRLRAWTDASGTYTIEAELVDVDDKVVRLKKKDGETIEVEIAKLSEADQQFLAKRAKPAAKTTELKLDDGSPAGKKSFPMGCAVELETPQDTAIVTAVRIHGARYGAAQAPDEEFHVTLCDRQFKPIEEFAFAYSKFDRGESQWVDLPITPTEVPKQFVICVNFAPTRSKGVYVSHDADGQSLVGLPNKPSGQFNGGHWMIRAVINE